MIWERIADLWRPIGRAVSARFGRGGGEGPGRTAAFTSAFVAIAAKMAKADGVAVTAEWEAFERFLEIDPGERDNVRRLYDLAKRDSAGFESYASRIGILLRDEPELMRRVLECLIYVACSDGVLHPAEDAFLGAVAEKFGLSRDEFRHMRSLFVRDRGDPYEILGVAHDARDAELRARYLELVAKLHPDKLMAAGAERAIIKAATAKLAAVNGAYEAIVAERKNEAALGRSR